MTHQQQVSIYNGLVETDFPSGISNCIDPRAYLASSKRRDPDTPSFMEAVTGADQHEWEEALKMEIKTLLSQNTWSRVNRSDIPLGVDGAKHPVLKGMWALKIKRLPDGSPLKFKARYVVRGDMQKEGIDYHETYAPVVQWSSIRLLLTLVLAHNWTTKQVDYTNAFAQAKLKEEVYVEPPKGFTNQDGQDKVPKLHTSLYGLKQAPRTFFQKLRAGLLERGFVQSDHDERLFLKKDMICVVYVDDTILAGPDQTALDAMIKSLGVREADQSHSFGLRDEGEVGDFLGIRIKKCGDKFLLTQPGLTRKVLKVTGMEDCNATSTPATTVPLGLDKDGEPFDEKWEYASVIGMLMYLANNSRPDIAFAVNQCARFTHQPKQSHAGGVKRILRYLKGTMDKGMYLQPTKDLSLDCHVDADFAGLYGFEHDQDPICVKSRTGYLITFMNCPLLWVSKLQSLIALSTMEAEYIALSQAMRDLIALRGIIMEIKHYTFNGDLAKLDMSTISPTFIPHSLVHEDNEACLKFATMPKISPRTKHIAIPYHFFRSKVENMENKVVSINTSNQLADQFTKGLPGSKFTYARKALMGW